MIDIEHEETSLAYQIFSLAFKHKGAITLFAEGLSADEIAENDKYGLIQFYSALVEFHSKTSLDPIDPIAFKSWLDSDTEIVSAIGGAAMLDLFIKTMLDLENADPYAVLQTVKVQAKKRKSLETAEQLQKILSKKTKADPLLITELTDKIRYLQSELNTSPFDRVVTANDIAANVKNLWEIPEFLPTQFKDLNKALGYDENKGGFFRGAVHALIAQSGRGKALALDTVLPTPNGWTTMENVVVGDQLFDENGNICQITHVYDIRYGRPCYKVTFHDGSILVADEEHEWLTNDYASRRAEVSARYYQNRGFGDRPQCVRSKFPSIKTTLEIKDTLYTPDGRYRNHAISTTQPLALPNKDLPVDPYVLGVWLGDGHSADGRITNADEELFQAITQRGYILSDKISENGKAKTRTVFDLKVKLRNLGVLDNKHIPAMYLRSSFEQRLSLLRGLMDTDGWKEGGRAAFVSTRKTLTDGVAELAVSLGWKTFRSERPARLYGVTHGVAYCVRFRPVHHQPFTLERKFVDMNLHQETRHKRRYITEVEEIPSVPVRCIAVDSPSHLYLAGEAMVPTHNSTLAKSLSNHWLDNGYRVLYINYEEPQPLWERILLTQITRHNVYYGIADAKEKVILEQKFKERMASWGDRLMVRHDPDTPFFEDLESWLYDLIGTGEKQPDAVIIDTIQSLFTRGRSGARWGQYEEMMVHFEKLARDMKAAFILTAQENTNRMKEGREVVLQSDTGGSIAIQQKCAVTIFITDMRKALQDDSIDAKIMELQIPKNRITGTTFAMEPARIKYNDEIKLYEPWELEVNETSFQQFDEFSEDDF